MFLSVVSASAIGTLSLSLKIDNIGYRPADLKRAVCVQNPGAAAEIRDSQTHALAYSITKVSNYGADADSGDTVWLLDFTAFSTPGKYYVYVPSLGIRSYEFEIDNAIYNRVGEAAMRGFYYQRCNAPKLTVNAGVWNDTICHTNDFHMNAWPGGGLAGHGTIAAQANLGVLDLHGGWHDAGDYQKTPHWDRGVDELLWAYEVNPKAWRDNQLNIPESGNGIPDILDEISWELDFYIRCQRPDGHFLSSASGVDSTSTMDSPPSACNQTRGYIDAYPDEATAWSVLKLAHAAILYEKIGQTAKASVYRQAATNGWKWLTGRSLTGNVNNMKCAAASAVWRLVPGLTSAKTFVEGFTTWQTPPGSGGGVGPATYDYLPRAIYHYLANTNGSATVKNNMKTGYANNAVNVIRAERDAYCGLRTQDYNWGSSAYQATYGFRLFMADYFGILGAYTSFQDMRNHAQNYLHYLLGRNTMSMVYYTSMQDYGGEHSCFQTYHSWFSYRPYSTDGDNGNTNFNGKPPSVVEPFYPYYTGDNIANDNFTSKYGPAPGILVGGPNANYSGDYVPPKGQTYPARFYRDFSKGCAWSGSKCVASGWEITECSLGYMGPGVLLIAFNMVDAKVTVSGFSPSSGCVGSTVTIRGDSFGQTRGTGFVSIGGVRATIYPFWSATNVQAVVPSDALTGRVSLTNQYSTGWLSTNDFSIPAPTVSSYTPRKACPGDFISVTGTGFGAVRGNGFVRVSGIATTNCPSWNNTGITFVCPSITNSGQLTVFNDCGGGGIAATNLELFCANPLAFFRIEHDREAVKGRPELMTVRAMDAYSNVKNDFAGTVTLSVAATAGEIVWQAGQTNATFADGGLGKSWAVCTFRPSEAGVMKFFITDLTSESIDVECRDRTTGLTDNDAEGFLRVRDLNHFKLVHDGGAFVNLAETVVLRAESTNGAAVPYSGVITIGLASAPVGTASISLEAGWGILTPLAGNRWVYSMVLADAGVATLSVNSTAPDSWDIEATDGWVRDDDSAPQYLDFVNNNYRFVRKNNPTPVSPYVTPGTAATNIAQAVAVSLADDVILILDGASYPALNLTGLNMSSRKIAVSGTNHPRIMGAGATPALNTDDTAANARGAVFQGLRFVNPTGALRNLLAGGGGGRAFTNGIFIDCTFSNAGADGDNAAPDTCIAYYFCSFVGNGTYAVRNGGDDTRAKDFFGNDVRGFQMALENIDIGPVAGCYFVGLSGTLGGITEDAFDGSTAVGTANNTAYRCNAGGIDGYNLMWATNNLSVSNNVSLNAGHWGVDTDTATSHGYNWSYGNGLGNNFADGTGTGDTAADPGFVNGRAGDFRLRFDAPAYNMGRPDPATGVRPCPGAHIWGVRLADRNVGTVTSYTLVFAPFIPLPASGWIQLDFPTGTGLSAVTSVTSTMDGGLTWESSGSRLILKRNGSGSLVPGLRAHRIIIKGVKNPSTGSRTYSILAGTREGSPGKLEGDWIDYPRLSNCFEVAQMPTIFSVAPSKFCPGSSVTVTGTNFGSVAGGVSFGGVNASSIGSWSDTLITVTVPVAVADGPVRVSNTAGYAGAGFGSYSYRPAVVSIAPTVICPGTAVTVRGSGFRDLQGTGNIRFGGILAAGYLSWCDTNVVAIAPSGLSAGNVFLTNDCGFGYEYGAAWAAFPVTNILLSAADRDHSMQRYGGTKYIGVETAGNVFYVGNQNIGGGDKTADHRAYLTFGLNIPMAAPLTSATLYLRTSAISGTPVYPVIMEHVKYSNVFTADNAVAQARYDCTTPSRAVLGVITNFASMASATTYGIPCFNQVQTSRATPVGWTENGANRVFQVRLRDSDADFQNDNRVVFDAYGSASAPLLRVRYQLGTNKPAYTLPVISISGRSPTNGPVGTAVTITGSGFCASRDAGFVSFNGLRASSYIAWNDTSITVLVPSGASSGPLRVTNACGAGASAGLFTVNTVMGPPGFVLTRKVTNIVLAGRPANPVPGSTATIKVVCSNSSTNACRGSLLLERIPAQMNYVSNSLQTALGWTAEWSTNTLPDQSWLSPHYSVLSPPGTAVRWIRWKHSLMPSGTVSVFRYNVRIR